MNKIILPLLLISLSLISYINSFSYNNHNYTTGKSILNDSDVIAEVNKNAALIDQIHTEGELAIKTPSMDESGSIEIKMKKQTDVWYRIYGSFAIFSKDAFFGHFTRKNFVFVNNMNESIIEGRTTDTNIGYITRIRCSFDDIMNVMSGTCYIPVDERDSVYSEDDPSYYLISIKSPSKVKKYWINKDDYSVSKYFQYDDKNDIYLTVEYSNFVKANGSAYAKKIVLQRPAKREKMSLYLTEVSLNQYGLNFRVDMPSDYRKIKWF